MALDGRLQTRRCELNESESTRIQNQRRALEPRLEHSPGPTATLAIEAHGVQRRVAEDLSVQLGRLAGHLICHQAAATPDRAVRLAVDDIERQLERRLPEALRPRPLKRRSG